VAAICADRSDGAFADGPPSEEVRMLDLAGILFSSVMMLVVIVQAVRLDRSQPWFQTVKRQEKPVDQEPKAWRRQR
jgi:hypothetical protein